MFFMKQIKLNIDGMKCEGCVSRVNEALSALDGVTDINVSLKGKSVDCTADEDKTTESDIISAINALGFKASAQKKSFLNGLFGQ